MCFGKKAKEKAKAEQAAAQKAAAEKAYLQKLAAETAYKQKLAAETAFKQKLADDTAKAQQENARVEAEKAAADKAIADKAAADKAAADKAIADKAAADKAIADKAAADKIAAENATKEAKPVKKPVVAKDAKATKAVTAEAKPAVAKATKAVTAEAKPVAKEAKAAKVATETVIVAGDEAVQHGKFVIKKTDKDKYIYKLFSSNHRVVAIGSEQYASIATCKSGINSVINNAESSPIEDLTVKVVDEKKCPKWQVYTDKKGEIRLRLIASNGNIVATTNDGYVAKDSAMNGIAAISRAVKGCDIVRNDDLW